MGLKAWLFDCSAEQAVRPMIRSCSAWNTTLVARLAERWFYPELSTHPINRHVHKHIERYWDAVRGDPVRRERFGEIAKAAPTGAASP